TLHEDLVIETTPPPAQPKSLDFSDTAAVDRFIDEWAASKFKNEQVNGVMVQFIHKNKLSKIRVEIGATALKEGLFRCANRDELIHRLQEKMKAGDRDAALLAATS